MGDYTRRIPPGLSLAQHQQLGDRLRTIRAELLAVRAAVTAGEGSASPEYAAVNRVLKELNTLETLLSRAAVGQHGDTQPLGALQRLYGETPQPKEDP
jgi:hypothetical protein